MKWLRLYDTHFYRRLSVVITGTGHNRHHGNNHYDRRNGKRCSDLTMCHIEKSNGDTSIIKISTGATHLTMKSNGLSTHDLTVPPLVI